ncbi:hypothetical protein IG631_15684 [Alternaria alternata]|nr:hypothetical protein IG631_15684 [Alternaria alternata]
MLDRASRPRRDYTSEAYQHFVFAYGHDVLFSLSSWCPSSSSSLTYPVDASHASVTIKSSAFLLHLHFRQLSGHLLMDSSRLTASRCRSRRPIAPASNPYRASTRTPPYIRTRVA